MLTDAADFISGRRAGLWAAAAEALSTILRAVNDSTLSILMPVFDERRTVERAIEDALGASLPVAQRELIVVDDGSKDGTRELLEERKAAPEIKLVVHDRNLGKGAALQSALREATGEFSVVFD